MKRAASANTIQVLVSSSGCLAVLMVGWLGLCVCVRVGFLGWLGVCVDWFVGGRVRVGMPGLVGCMGRAGGVFYIAFTLLHAKTDVVPIE